jgi:hypothetical protein
MPLSNDHDVIEAFSSDRADQAFAASVLPWRAGRSGWFVANAHRAQTPLKDIAMSAIALNAPAGLRSRVRVVGDGLRELLFCNLEGEEDVIRGERGCGPCAR